MDGWIKIHRKILEWEWYSDSKTVHLFLHLLISANHKPKRYKGQVIKRGQVVVGRGKLAQKLGLSEQQVRTCIKRLKSTSELTTKVTNKHTIVTLTNYESYQTREENQPANQPANQPTINQQLTNNQPATNHKQECNKDNNERKEEERKKYPQKIFEEICQMFGLDELETKTTFQFASSALTLIYNEGQGELFEKQLAGYKKNKEQQFWGGVRNFFGEIQEPYPSGRWNERQWYKDVKNIDKNKTIEL